MWAIARGAIVTLTSDDSIGPIDDPANYGRPPPSFKSVKNTLTWWFVYSYLESFY
jgi:hypothetical protein